MSELTKIAVAAFAGTSMTPEKRAAATLADWQARMEQDAATMREASDMPPEEVEREIEEHRRRCDRAFRDWLYARARCMSVLVTGPSNFPVRRQEKVYGWERNKSERLEQVRKASLSRFFRRFGRRLDSDPIRSGDDDAIERIEARIRKAEEQQAFMVKANRAIRSAIRLPQGDRVPKIVAMLSISEQAAAALLTPDFANRIGFADYQLKNNGAEIRRLKARLESVRHTKAEKPSELKGADGVRVEIDPSANRVRIFFPYKPSRERIDELKRHAFRWTPTLGCWQAYCNHRAISMAQRFASAEKVVAE